MKKKANRNEEQAGSVLESESYHFSEKHHHRRSSSSRLDILLEQYVEAAKRARLSLIIISLTSLLLIVGVFNHQWSWLSTKEYRQHQNWPEELKEPIDPIDYQNGFDALIAALNRISQNDQPEYPRQQIHDLLDVQMKTVEVPILGIQIYSEDLPILGGFGVMLILAWFYFIRRRERGIVKMLDSMLVFADPRKKKQMAARIYATLAFSQVFNTVPNVDNFNVKVKWNLVNKPLRVFYNSLPFIPCLIFAFVLIVDFIETYQRTGLGTIPNESYFTSHYADFGLADSTTFKYSSPPFKQWFADTWIEAKEHSLRDHALEQIDSILVNFRGSNYKRTLRLKHEAEHYKNQVTELRKKIFTTATPDEFLQYHEWEFEEYQHMHMRFGLSLYWEIRLIRTALPFIILMGNIILAFLARRSANSRNFHMRAITLEYEKQYPINYNIYGVSYAYIHFKVKNEIEEPLNEVLVTAKNNAQKNQTNAQGYVRFIELKADEEEEFTFSDRTGKNWKVLIPLGHIDRYRRSEIDSKAKSRRYRRDKNKAYNLKGELVDRFQASKEHVRGEVSCIVVLTNVERQVVSKVLTKENPDPW